MTSIDITTLSKLTDVTVVDVREEDEYTAGHAPGAANVPLSALVERAAEIPRDRPVYVICESGGRSAQATQWLDAQGVDAVNVLGGTSAWRGAGLPVEGGN